MTNTTRYLRIAMGLILWFGAGDTMLATDYRLESPDGRIKISIQIAAQGDVPRWHAMFNGNVILTNCALGLQINQEGELLKDVRVLRKHSTAMEKKIQVLFGKAAFARDTFHELLLELKSPERSQVNVIFRCYNDAVALRYELPKSSSVSITVSDETTSFGISGEPTGYVQYLENYNTSHEHNVTASPITEVTNH